MIEGMSAPPVNPYAPPPSAAQPVEIDFREAAVEESLRIIEAAPGRPIDDLSVSLVLPTDLEGPARIRHIGRMTVLRLVSGVAGLALGALLAALEGPIHERLMVPQFLRPGLVMSVAACGTFGGMGFLLSSVFFVRRAVRGYLGERYAAVVRMSNLRRPLCVGVEDARTFTTMKIAPEDFAYIAFDAASRRVILEGLTFRYVIHAHDVYSVSQASGTATTGVQIVFRVARVYIGITLQYDSVVSELKKQTIGLGRDPLLRPIRQTFGLAS
jgi:hypothetical protein